MNIYQVMELRLRENASILSSFLGSKSLIHQQKWNILHVDDQGWKPATFSVTEEWQK